MARHREITPQEMARIETGARRGAARMILQDAMDNEGPAAVAAAIDKLPAAYRQQMYDLLGD